MIIIRKGNVPRDGVERLGKPLVVFQRERSFFPLVVVFHPQIRRIDIEKGSSSCRLILLANPLPLVDWTVSGMLKPKRLRDVS